MTMAAGSSSVVSLTSKDFPPKFENVFCARCQSLEENAPAEKVMVTGADRRQFITVPALDDLVEDPNFGCRILDSQGFRRDESGWGLHDFPGIGLLRMEFNGAVFTGTASMIAEGSCLLTCAHNVVDYDRTIDKFVYATSGWFELRKNKEGGGSDVIKRYAVTEVVVYPPYFENPTSESGFDLALCWIHVPQDDHTVKGLYLKHRVHMPTPYVLLRRSYWSEAAVVGFPGEHKGEKWGMIAAVPDYTQVDWEFVRRDKCGGDKDWNPWNWEDFISDKKEILVYRFIDTSPGQSGSPVMVSTSRKVIGVHTGGSTSLKKNWATRITPAKLHWIANSLGHPWNVCGDFDILFLTADYRK